jgi:dTDP-4-dehydrorhamnose reductase
VGSPTAASDLAAAIRRLVRKQASGIVHVTNRGSCSWFEYALFVVHEAGLKTRVLPVASSEFPRPAVRPAYSVLSHRRYEEITGRAMRPWEEAVREYLSSKFEV